MGQLFRHGQVCRYAEQPFLHFVMPQAMHTAWTALAGTSLGWSWQKPRVISLHGVTASCRGQARTLPGSSSKTPSYSIAWLVAARVASEPLWPTLWWDNYSDTDKYADTQSSPSCIWSCPERCALGECTAWTTLAGTSLGWSWQKPLLACARHLACMANTHHCHEIANFVTIS